MDRIRPRSPMLLVVLLLGAGTVLAMDQMPICVYLERATDQNPTPEIQSHGSCAIIQPDGSPTIHPDHLAAIDFGDDVAPALVGDQWYYVTPDGRTAPVIPFDNGADPFHEGLARTSSAGKIGFIDKTLRVVIPPRYDFAWPFENGRSLVCMGCKPGEPDSDGHGPVVGGEWGVIDSAGRAVIPIRFTRDEALALGSQ